MENSQQSLTRHCLDHPQNDLAYCCFDPECQKKILTCVICLKNNHQNCNDCFIILASDLVKRVEIIRHDSPSTHRKNFVNQIRALMQWLIGQLLIGSHTEHERIVNEVENKVASPEYRLTTDSLRSNKNDLSIEFNPQTSTIEVKHKGINSLDRVRNSIAAFESKISRVLDELMSRMNNLRVLAKKHIQLRDWAASINLVVSENDDGSITILRKENSLSFGKVCIAVLSFPVSYCDFEVEIVSNGKSSKLVELGFIDHEAYGLVKDTLDIRPPIGKIVYYNGLTKSGSLMGKEPLGSIGFDANTSVTVEFKENVIRFYSLDSALDLESTFVSSQAYFYCSLEDEGICIRVHHYA